MGWERMPLYPGERRLGCGCYQIPLFGDGRRPGGEPCSTQTVRLENPCCPGECASVTLSVDACGDLCAPRSAALRPRLRETALLKLHKGGESRRVLPGI